MGFSFKKFHLIDENTPMKIGIDSVILGAWADGRNADSVLDIGSGCGILSFMLAQRFNNVNVTGVEIYEEAYDDSITNLELFLGRKKIRFFNNDIKDWETESEFDLIISNPPYFSGSIIPKDEGRFMARFQSELSLVDLAKSVEKHLSDRGNFSLLMPYSEYSRANNVFNDFGLFLHRKTEIKHLPNSDSKRILLEYRKSKSNKIYSSELIIKNLDGNYTNEFISLTKDFYLDF